jgi:hypothetical protein
LSTLHSTNKTEYIGIDFGIERPVQTVKIYLYHNDSSLITPESYALEYWDGKRWKAVPDQKRNPELPEGGKANIINFKELKTSRLRAVFKSKGNNKVAVSEFEAWGRREFPIKPGNGHVKNLAYKSNAAFSSSYTSSTSRFDHVAGINNGLDNPNFRWTAFESPNKTDWIQFDFGLVKLVDHANLFIYDDKGGVQPPEKYTINYWNGRNWVEAENQKKIPEDPQSQLNQCFFDQVKTSKIRIVFTHKKSKAFSGIYELELYRPEKQQ